MIIFSTLKISTLTLNYRIGFRAISQPSGVEFEQFSSHCNHGDKSYAFRV